MDEQHQIVSKAARVGDAPLEWNEIDFVGWAEFRRMAPTVVRLEIARVERLMAATDVGSDLYNTLVRVRFALRHFVDGIEEAERGSAVSRGQHLEQALLALSAALGDADSKTVHVLRYVAHRLTYIHDRLRLIY